MPRSATTSEIERAKSRHIADRFCAAFSAAASYVRSRAVAFGIQPPSFDKKDIHVHVPEGATPRMVRRLVSRW